MNLLYKVIDQYQRGFTDVLNRLFYFRKGMICFRNRELNVLYNRYSAQCSENKLNSFLECLHLVFTTISLSQFITNKEIINLIEEKLY